jgi:hypothetical protein
MGVLVNYVLVQGPVLDPRHDLSPSIVAAVRAAEATPPTLAKEASIGVAEMTLMVRVLGRRGRIGIMIERETSGGAP